MVAVGSPTRLGLRTGDLRGTADRDVRTSAWRDLDVTRARRVDADWKDGEEWTCEANGLREAVGPR
jgi:hypothetical protein